MAKSFYEEHLHWRHLSLLHEEPTVFIVSQWQHDKSVPNIKYLIYRSLILIFLLVTWIIAADPGWYNFLTNWSYSMLTWECMLAVLLLLVSILDVRYLKKSTWQENILKLHPLYWIGKAVSQVMGLTVTLVYWTMVAIFADSATYRLGVMEFILHAVNSIIILVDLAVIAHPVKILHFIYPALFGICYGIYSVIYHSFDKNRGGTGWVYPILDWDKPQIAGPVLVVVFFLILLMHFMTFWIHKFRQRVHDNKLKKV